MSCAGFVVEVCKRAGARIPRGFNFVLEMARRWEAATPYAAGVRIRPASKATQTGFEYESSGGVSGSTEPKWPRRLASPGHTVIDGSIVWTARELSFDSLLERIASATWTADSGITATEIPEVDNAAEQSSSVTISGGTVGTTYAVSVLVTTTEANIYGATLAVEITA